MDFLQGCNYVNIVPPAASISSGSATVNSYVDTIGAGKVTFIIQCGALAADSTAIKIQECDTSGGSYVDITNGSATTFKTATDANGISIISLAIAGSRKRFMKPVFTAGAGATYIACIAVLSELQQSAYNTTTRGTLYETFLIS